jgi:transposase
VTALESRVVGALPLLRHISGQLEIVDVIDSMVPWDARHCRLSPGQRIEALILNTLAGRSPLYRVAEFYEDTATELIFGPGVLPEALGDDALARALDKLAEAGPRRVYSAVAARACLLEGIEHDFLHYDTTSISLFGDYPDDPPQDLQLTYGYSKDNHPELKQFVLGILGNRQGIPIWADARDGNSEDTQANADVIDTFCSALSPEQLRRTVHVADSKLVTPDNLRRLHKLGVRFLSRLPDTYAAGRAAKEAAIAGDQWEDLDALARNPRSDPAHYRASEQSGVIDGRPYRLVVIHSDHLAARKRATFEAHLVKKRAAAEKALATIGKRRFESLEAAGEASAPLLALSERGPFRLRLAIQERTRRVAPDGRRGRPRKDDPAHEITEYVITGQIEEPDPASLDRERSLLGLFVLITDLDRNDYPARRLLEEYRDQGSVEQRFAFLKDPCFVDGIFLKTPRRIEALAYVIVIACLLYSIFERRVRAKLQARNGRILLPGKRWSDNPTGKMLLALVEHLVVCRLAADARWWLCSPPRTIGRAEEVARYAGLDLLSIYGPPP